MNRRQKEALTAPLLKGFDFEPLGFGKFKLSHKGHQDPFVTASTLPGEQPTQLIERMKQMLEKKGLQKCA